MDTDVKSVEKVNEELVNQLIVLGLTQKKAVDTASLFLFSWMKSKGEKISLYEYENDVKIFLEKLKKSS
ncbi:MAG TPA: hypothetical protein P5059_01000 [Candidatus Dojkabacteria bacterium]|jgi:hypothetical protein|nr:hypothetical protein [Candidatus Dojkabacteria bacterium]